jgi:polyhydroxyalkanoate synthesis repressor PhaR
MAESVRIIKKYQNRKLYDTQDSCYVTLDGIAKMIRQGEEIVVIDNNTKDDVTALIFTQVLYEQEKTNQSVLPVIILKNIIKAGSNNLFEFMQKFILQSLTAPARAQEEIQLHIDRLVKKGDLNAQEGASLTAQMRQLTAQTQESLDQKIQQRVTENMANVAANPQMGAQLQDIATRLQSLEGRPS